MILNNFVRIKFSVEHKRYPLTALYLYIGKTDQYTRCLVGADLNTASCLVNKTPPKKERNALTTATGPRLLITGQDPISFSA